MTAGRRGGWLAITATLLALVAARGEAQSLAVDVPHVSSSTATLEWPAVTDAASIRVILGVRPPRVSGAPLPDVTRELITLPGTASGTVISGLAPSVHAFLRVEAYDADAHLLAAGNAHAVTTGGPRVVLDTPARRVHLYAPDVLLVVVENHATYNSDTGSMDDDTGPAWQGGTWTVQRNDGTPLAVTSVSRHSIPVGQPGYIIGYHPPWQTEHPELIDVDHWLFLHLAQNVGSSEILDVSHTGTPETTEAFILPFSDRYLDTPVVQLNQVGYSPRATRRYAYVSGWMGDGGGLSLANFPGTVDVISESPQPLGQRLNVLQDLPLVLRAANDADAGTEVRQVDLAVLPAEEGVRYRIRVPGVGVSWPTAVSETAVFRAFWTVLRGMFLNRWCGDLSPQYTDWVRPENGPYGRRDHCAAYVADFESDWNAKISACTPPPGTPAGTFREIFGGHHDAGDFDIRPMHVLVGQYLMRAYELHPSAFTDGQLVIPESGNGIPDLLDEALWSVAAWEALQEADGGVRMGVESTRHPWGYYYANDEWDDLNFCTYTRGVHHTAWVSGLFAQAAYLVQPFDAARASGLRDRAVAAFAWAQAHGASVRMLSYGAGELYRLTGQTAYKTAFEDAWAASDKWGGGMFDGGMQNMVTIYPGDFQETSDKIMADFLMGYVNGADPNSDIRDTTLARLPTCYNPSLVIDSTHAHRTPRVDQNPDWGEATAVGGYWDRAYQDLQLSGGPTSKQDVFDALSLSLDFALGANPMGMVFITGLGSVHPEEALHIDSLAFVKDTVGPQDMVPGIPIYGVWTSVPGSGSYARSAAAFYPAFVDQPIMRRIVDTREWVVSSEFTVWETQALHAALTSALLPTGMTPPADWYPGQPHHRDTLAPLERAVGVSPDPPSEPTLTLEDASTGETDEGATTMSVTVTLEEPAQP
jgi:endoglucanase